MKKIGWICMLLASMPLSTFAAKVDGADIRLDRPLRVGYVDVPPGDYRLIWSGSGDEVQVTWLEHYAKVIATGRAKAVEERNEAIARQRNPFWVDTIQHGRFMVLKAIQLPNVTLFFEDVRSSGR